MVPVIWITNIEEDSLLKMAEERLEGLVRSDNLYSAIENIPYSRDCIIVINEYATLYDLDKVKEAFISNGLAKKVITYRFPAEQDEYSKIQDLLKNLLSEDRAPIDDSWPILPPTPSEIKMEATEEQEKKTEGPEDTQPSREGKKEFIRVDITQEELQALLGEEDDSQ